MRQTNENTSLNLKLVMLFDWRKQIYCICSHNLLPEDASAEVTELRRDGLLLCGSVAPLAGSVD